MSNLRMTSRNALPNLVPTLNEETRLWAAGYGRVAGLDEVGRGALAGPVVAAAVIVPQGATLQGVWATVRDSKLLRPAARLRLVEPIQQSALAWGVGVVTAEVIDAVGIATATRQAMVQAIGALGIRPDFLLIDWVKLPQVGLPQICVPKADQKMASVAAASILAKVTR
jgi:ribonuclease HII